MIDDTCGQVILVTVARLVKSLTKHVVVKFGEILAVAIVQTASPIVVVRQKGIEIGQRK